MYCRIYMNRSARPKPSLSEVLESVSFTARLQNKMTIFPSASDQHTWKDNYNLFKGQCGTGRILRVLTFLDYVYWYHLCHKKYIMSILLIERTKLCQDLYTFSSQERDTIDSTCWLNEVYDLLQVVVYVCMQFTREL